MNRLAALAATALLLAGCAAGLPSASPSPSPVASGSTDGFVLRTAVHQAIPPDAAFRTLRPPVDIEDGVAILYGPMDAIAPAPLLPVINAHEISDAGIRQIIDGATAAGLLSGSGDFTAGGMPGSRTAEIVLGIDGTDHRLTGDPDRQIVCVTAPCEPQPGTPEAFGWFWAKLTTLPDWLGDELGQPAPWVPERMAILLTEPMLDANLPIQYEDWPLATPMAEFGGELPGSPANRCGVVTGADLGAALQAFGPANEYTRWRDDAGNERGVVARPLLPGEDDPCTLP